MHLYVPLAPLAPESSGGAINQNSRIPVSQNQFISDETQHYWTGMIIIGSILTKFQRDKELIFQIDVCRLAICLSQNM